jgi:arylsulfatase A-like enzyme
LAESGVHFTRAFVNTHGTPPSHTTILSSLYQETHRVQYNDLPSPKRYRIPERVPLLQEHLQRAGYTTLGVTAGAWMAGKFGYARGFSEFDDESRGVVDGAGRLVEMVRRRSGSDEPLFAFLHTYEIHIPYTPPERYRKLFGSFVTRFEASGEKLTAINVGRLVPTEEELRYVVAMYDAGIRFTDDVLRDMFRELEALGFFEHAVVVVTSDHGEELYERGVFGHRGLLYDELLHVPLIIRATGVPPRVDSRLASSIDITPTILAMAGVSTDTILEGHDLLQGSTSRDAVFAQYEGRSYAIRTEEWKLIVHTNPGLTELYDLLRDPNERENLADVRPEVREDLSRRLSEWRKARPELDSLERFDVAIDEAERERLRALGYLD